VQGSQGFQGAQGNEGFQGTQGVQGNVGFQGRQGVQGPQGNQGNIGFQGVDGPNTLRFRFGNDATTLGNFTLESGATSFGALTNILVNPTASIGVGATGWLGSIDRANVSI
jgi:hypothetical protein